MKDSSFLDRLLGREKSDPKKSADEKMLLENLEPRILYSAAPVDGGAPEAESDSAPEPSQEAPDTASDDQLPAEGHRETPQSSAVATEPVLDTEVYLLADETEASGAEGGAESTESVELGTEEEDTMEVIGESLLEIDEWGHFSNEAVDSELSPDVVNWMAEAAAERWRMTGLSEEQSLALANVVYQVVDLPGNYLGAVEGNVVTIDADAAGRTWFIDETPLQNEEFSSLIEGETQLFADADSGADGRLDLLSILMHEQGHILGLNDVYESSSQNIMYAFFEDGERRLASDGQADGVVAGSLEGIHFATYTWDGGGTDSNWDTIENWTPDTLPDDSNSSDWDTIIFDGTTGLNSNVNFAGDGGGYNIESVIFESGAGAYTLTGNKTGGGSIALDMLGNPSGTADIVNRSSETQTLNLDLRHRAQYNSGLVFDTEGADIVVNGRITKLSSATQPVSIVGPNTVTFNGDNSYSDPTVVGISGEPGSTLVFNGSQSGASTLTVSSGSTLKGSGSTDAAVTVSGTLSPGASTGGLGDLMVGELTFTSGSVFEAQIDSNAQALAGVGNDVVRASGNVTIGDGIADLLISSSGTNPAAHNFLLIDNTDPSGVTSGYFNDGAGNALMEGATVTVGTVDYTLSYWWGPDGNDVALYTGSVRPVAIVTTGDSDGGSDDVDLQALSRDGVTYTNLVGAVSASASGGAIFHTEASAPSAAEALTGLRLSNGLTNPSSVEFTFNAPIINDQTAIFLGEISILDQAGDTLLIKPLDADGNVIADWQLTILESDYGEQGDIITTSTSSLYPRLTSFLLSDFEGGSGTLSGVAGIQVTNADADSDTFDPNIAGTFVLDAGVAPSNVNINLDTSSIQESQSVSLTGSFTLGGNSTNTVVIDWGDGTVDTEVLTDGTTDFTGNHQYLNDGNFQVTVSVEAGTLSSGLAGLWNFDDGSAVDQSGLGNNGSGGTYSSDTPFGVGQALSDGRVSVSTSDSLETLDDQVTIAFWAKIDPSTTDNWERTIVKAGGGEGWHVGRYSNSTDLNIRTDTTGTDGANNQNKLWAGDDTLDNQWHHIVFTLDNGVAKQFVDGVLVQTDSYLHGDGLGNSGTLYIGDTNLGGSMDEVALWSRILTDDEIRDASGPIHIGGDSTFATVTVSDVPPVVDTLQIVSKDAQTGEMTLQIDFTDPGSLDEHKAVIDWGDGNAVTEVLLTTGARTLQSNHTYASPATHQISVTVLDRLGDAVGIWSFDDGNAQDSSGNANDGTGGSYSTDVADVFGGGQSLDGAGSAVTVANSLSLEGIDDEMTLSFWVKGDSSEGSWVRVIRKGTEAGGTTSWLVTRYGSTDDLLIRTDTTGTGGNFNGNQHDGQGGPILDDTWHHVVYVLNNGLSQEYVDGVLTNQENYAHGDGLSNTEPLTIGTALNASLLDEVILYDRALTSGQVASLSTGPNVAEARDAGSLDFTFGTTIYVNDDWGASSGDSVDGDVEVGGNQGALFGTDAFDNFADAVNALNPVEDVTLIINAGDYSGQDLDLSGLTNNVTVKFVGGDSSIASLTGGTNVTVELGGVDGTHTTATTLTVGSGDFAGVISGEGGLTKTGTGRLTLSGDSSYAGVTQIDGGNLRISHDGALGAATGKTTIDQANKARLELTGGITIGDTIELTGSQQNVPALDNISGDNTITAQLSIVGGSSRIRSSAGNLTFAGGVGASGNAFFVVNATGGAIHFTTNPINLNSGTFYTDSGGLTTIGVAGNTWSSTTLTSGTLRLDVDNALASSATFRHSGLGYGSGGTLDLNGTSQTVASLFSGGTNQSALDAVVTSATAATLTVNQSGDTTYRGTIDGAVTLAKDGSGTLTLTGANNYVGSTNAVAGSLVVDGGSISGTDTVSIDAGKLQVVNNGSVAVTNGVSNAAGSGTLQIDDGTMTVGNGLDVDSLRVGFDALDASLTVQDGDVLIGDGTGILDIGRRNGPSGADAKGIVNLSGADSVTIDVDEIRLGTDATTDFGQGGSAEGDLTLSTAGTNTVTASSFLMGSVESGSNLTRVSELHLGGAANVFNLDSLTVGGRKSVGFIDIVDGGTFTLAGDANAETDFQIGYNDGSGTGTNPDLSQVDLTGGTFNAALDELVIGAHHSGSGSGKGVLTYTAGTVTANSAVLAAPDSGGSSSNDANTRGTLNLGGGVLDLQNGTLSEGGGTRTFAFTDGTLKDIDLIGFSLNQQGGIIQIGEDGASDTMTVDGDFTLTAGTLHFDLHGLGGPGAADGHDQLIVNGELNLDDTNSTIAFDLSGYTPTSSDPAIVLISNNDPAGAADATDAVSGFFASHPDADGDGFSDLFSVSDGSSSYVFRINYAGGDGNDVVLESFGLAETSVELVDNGGVDDLVITDMESDSEDRLEISFDDARDVYIIHDPNLILSSSLPAGTVTQVDVNTIEVAASAVTGGIRFETANGADAAAPSGFDQVTITSLPEPATTPNAIPTSLVVNAEQIVLGSNVVSGSTQTYNGAVTLGADVTLTAGGDVTFASTVDSDTTARALIVNTGNNSATTFGDFVGTTAALASLSTNADGALSLGQDVTTVGDQTYNDATATLTAGVTMTGANVTLGSVFSNSGNGLGVDAETIDVTGGIDGQGGLIRLNASSTTEVGVHIGISAALATSGGGTISLAGSGGVLVEADVTTEKGNITITGSASVDDGVAIVGATVSSTGQGRIEISGSGGDGSSTFAVDSDAGSSISTADGFILVETTTGSARIGGNVDSGAHTLTLDSAEDLNLVDTTVVGGTINLEADSDVNLTSGVSISGPDAALGNVVIHSQNFESFPQGSTNAGANVGLPAGEGWGNARYEPGPDTLDFVSDRDGTPSPETGPGADHTHGDSTGTYLFLETSGTVDAGEFSHLLSPVIDLTGQTNSAVEFFYHMYSQPGTGMGTLTVQGSSDGGATWSADLLSVSGDQGDSWNQAVLDLSSFDNSAQFQLRIIGTKGTDYRGDIALDDFRFYADSGDLLVEDFETFGQGPTSNPRPHQTLPEASGWVNLGSVPVDQIDWSPDKGGTPSGGTGPGTDHTLGNANGTYLYIETSNPIEQGDTATLYSPTLDLSNHSTVSVDFWYHMLGGQMGDLKVYGSADGGSTWSAELFSVSGSQGNVWNQTPSIDLNAFAGSSNFVLRVDGIAGPLTSSTYQSDIALDDFRFYGELVTNTQITITADADQDGNGSGGAINMADGSTVNAGNGNVRLSADEDITVSSITTTATITAISTSGAIVDGGDSGTDLVASAFVATAAAGVGMSGNSLDTQLNNLEADGGTGGVFVSNTGDLVLGDAGAGLGIISTEGATVSIDSTNDLTVAANTIVRSSTVNLSADNDVSFLTGSQIQGPTQVTLLNETFDSFAQGSTSARATNIPLGNGWTNLQGTDDLDWSPDAEGTVSGGTGPTADHTTGNSTGKFLYIETSDPVLEGETATLYSPTLDLSGMQTANLEFHYHMYAQIDRGGGATDMGTLKAYGSTDGSNWTELFSVTENQGNQWNQATVSLDAFLGSPNFVLRVDGIAGAVSGDVSLGYQSDIAIDDFTITAVPVAGTVNVTVTADANGDANGSGGAIDMADGSSIVAGGGTVALSADGNVTVSSISSSGNVGITSGNGEILDRGESPDITAGTLTLNGEAAPGLGTFGTLEVSGDLDLDSNAQLTFEISGTTVGTNHDQVKVTGLVTLSDATFNGALGYAPNVGDQFIIIDNDGTDDDVVGVFTGLSEGTFLDLSYSGTSYTFSITYEGGDGNDVVLTAEGVAETEITQDGSGNLIITDITSDSNDTLTITPGANATLGQDGYTISDPNHIIATDVPGAVRISKNEVFFAYSVLENIDPNAEIRFNTGAGDDRLTVDLGTNAADVIHQKIVFNGGENSGDADELVVVNDGSTPLGTVTQTFTGAETGTIDLDSSGSVEIETTQLEAVDTTGSTVADLVLNLPAGDNADVVLRNSTNAGEMELVGSTFAPTTFSVPAGSLTINGGSDADAITIESLDSSFASDLIVNTGGGTDSVTISQALDFNGNLAITAETITLNASVDTTSGNQTYNGTLQQGTSGPMTLTAAEIYFNGDTTLQSGSSHEFQIRANTATNTAGNLFNINGGRFKLVGGTELINDGQMETGTNRLFPIFATSESTNKITNNGTFTINSTQLRLYVELTNTATGTVVMENPSGKSEVEFKQSGSTGPGGAIRNFGTITLSGTADHQFHEGGPGLINESGGIINFNDGGTVTVAENAKFTNNDGGIVNLNSSGTWTINSSEVISDGTVNLRSDFTLGGSNVLTFGASGILELSPVTGNRTLTLNNPGITTSGTTNFSADGSITLDGSGTFTNDGIFNHAYGGNNDNLVIGGSVTFQNNGTFDLKNRGDVQFLDGSTAEFVNNGTLKKSAAGSDPSFFFSFDKNSGTFTQTANGTVLAEAGRLRIASENVSSDAAGTWMADGGDIELGGTWTGTVTGTTTGSSALRITYSDNGSIETNFAAGAGGITFDVGGNGVIWNEQTIDTSAGDLINANILNITAEAGGGSAKVLTGTGSLITANGAITTITGTTVTGTSGPARLLIADGGTLRGSGTLETLIDGSVGSAIIADGALSLGIASEISFSTAGSIEVGLQTVTLLDSGLAAIGASTTLNGGTLIAANGLSMSSGDILGGHGTVDATVSVDSGTIEPGDIGDSTETLVVKSIDFGTGTVTMQVDGAEPGEHDVIQVTGTVDLDGATLDVSGIADPENGVEIVVIDNDDTDAVISTFSGLAEGAIVDVGGTRFKISYVGGDGNDVVLIRSVAPAVAAPGGVANNTGDSGTVAPAPSTTETAPEPEEVTESGPNFNGITGIYQILAGGGSIFVGARVDPVEAAFAGNGGGGTGSSSSGPAGISGINQSGVSSVLNGLPPLSTLTPFFAGTGQAGGQITVMISDGAGGFSYSQTVQVDAAGNWMMALNGVQLDDRQYTITVQPVGAIIDLGGSENAMPRLMGRFSSAMPDPNQVLSFGDIFGQIIDGESPEEALKQLE